MVLFQANARLSPSPHVWVTELSRNNRTHFKNLLSRAGPINVNKVQLNIKEGRVSWKEELNNSQEKSNVFKQT